jgi:hypothetical protein
MEMKPIEVEEVGQEEDYTPYPAADKQYAGNRRYTTYESIQTGAAGKAAK